VVRCHEQLAHQNADFAWPRDPQGISTGWWGIKLRPRDMVKLGQLFLAGGRWDNKQVVPTDWVDQATAPHVAAQGHSDGYGYQWWTATADGDDAFAAVGYGGQIIQVIPDRNVVVVTSTEMRENDMTSQGIDNGLLLNVIEDDIISQIPAD
jgi:CubicO group peptidase (beta-lactamase class C family)